jgi:hypothetical protein
MKRTSAVLLLFLALSASAFADPVLDFNISAPSAGSISFAGGSAPLVGSNITVDSVVGLNTPTNSTVTRNLLSAVLNFTTGGLSSSTSNLYNFGGGGSISLTGCADLNNNGLCDGNDANGTLLQGSFLSASVFSTGNGFQVDISSFLDQKNETLAAYYGLGGVYSWLGNTNISFLVPNGTLPPSSFESSQILSGDLTNTPAPVPEPASMLLLGSGVLGTWVRRRKRQ